METFVTFSEKKMKQLLKEFIDNNSSKDNFNLKIGENGELIIVEKMVGEFKQENGEFYALFRALKKKYRVKNSVLVEKLGETNANTLTWSVKAKYLSREKMESVVKAINPDLVLIIAEGNEGVKLEVMDTNEL